MEKSREDDFRGFSVDEDPAIACVGEERPTSRLLVEDSLLFSLNEESIFTMAILSDAVLTVILVLVLSDLLLVVLLYSILLSRSSLLGFER